MPQGAERRAAGQNYRYYSESLCNLAAFHQRMKEPEKFSRIPQSPRLE
jgi:hypothetical protein